MVVFFHARPATVCSELVDQCQAALRSSCGMAAQGILLMWMQPGPLGDCAMIFSMLYVTDRLYGGCASSTPQCRCASLNIPPHALNMAYMPCLKHSNGHACSRSIAVVKAMANHAALKLWSRSVSCCGVGLYEARIWHARSVSIAAVTAMTNPAALKLRIRIVVVLSACVSVLLSSDSASLIVADRCGSER